MPKSFPYLTPQICIKINFAVTLSRTKRHGMSHIHTHTDLYLHFLSIPITATAKVHLHTIYLNVQFTDNILRE